MIGHLLTSGLISKGHDGQREITSNFGYIESNLLVIQMI